MKSISNFLTAERLQHFFATFPDLKIAVLGDIALDAYWFADMTRSHLSRETPLFPRPIVREIYSPGAGGNVAQNLKALGVGEVVVFSVIGQDYWADILVKELNQRGICTTEILYAPERRTTAYVKPILMGYNSEQEDARLDFENTQPLPENTETELLERLEHRLSELHAVLVADQVEIHGVISERVRLELNFRADTFPQKIFLVDSRMRIAQFMNFYLKPNQIEAVQALGYDLSAGNELEDTLPQLGGRLSAHSGRPVFITLGKAGVLVCTPEYQEHIIAAPVTPPLDPVGAGDTFQSALAAALSAGASPCEAGAFANLAAAVTVEKLLQTGTASPAEILQRYELAVQSSEA